MKKPAAPVILRETPAPKRKATTGQVSKTTTRKRARKNPSVPVSPTQVTHNPASVLVDSE